MLTKEDLRERLFVAEKVMKSLFQRNKELEMTQGDAVQRCERCEAASDAGD
jgi:hypothetical protein